jgi:hypothetical protein
LLIDLMDKAQPTEGVIDRRRWEEEVTNELNQRIRERTRVVAWGHVGIDGAPSRTYNVSSITDDGSGERTIIFTAVAEAVLIVNAQAVGGEVTLTQKTPNGFSALTSKAGTPADLAFDFVVQSFG